MSSYRVISLHTDGQHCRNFRSRDRAVKYALTIDPEQTPDVVPNLPNEVITRMESAGWEYSEGFYWFDNRPVVIFVKGLA